VRDPLGLEIDLFRELGHALVDRIAEHWETLDDLPAVREMAIGELTMLAGPVPRAPAGPQELEGLIRTLADDALSNMQHAAHPRYFARVPSPASLTAILGEWLASGFNGIAASWAGGSGPSQLELVVIGWLAELLGFPPSTEGLLVSGGSIGNITALAAARSAGYDGGVYLSDQTHSSVLRGLRLLGLAHEQIHVVPTGSRYRWSINAIAGAMRSDDHGRGIIIATAGTTNTGAVDPLVDLADLCGAADLWFHIDGAYGAPAALTNVGRTALQGIERADSLTIDPHKWLFQPYDIGAVLVRRAGALEACFAMNPEYLRDVQTGEDTQVDLRNRGPELSRRVRAAKLWLTFKAHGADAIAAAIQVGIELADQAQSLIAADSSWELVTPAQLGVVTFAARGIDDAEHERRARALSETGFAAVSCTELSGRTVFRLCLINPRTTVADVAQTLAALRGAAESLR
jgi:aromatic-L-amino-acid/L-tryptophan decarboxylase